MSKTRFSDFYVSRPKSKMSIHPRGAGIFDTSFSPMASFRTFLLISALSVSGCAEKPSWKLFEKNDETAIYYLQNEADSGKHSVSIRYAFTSPQVFTKPDGSQVQFHVREETLLLKCDGGTFSTPDFSLHQPTEKGNAGVVYWQSVAPDKTEWIPIGDDSLAKKLMDSSIIAC